MSDRSELYPRWAPLLKRQNSRAYGRHHDVVSVYKPVLHAYNANGFKTQENKMVRAFGFAVSKKKIECECDKLWKTDGGHKVIIPHLAFWAS